MAPIICWSCNLAIALGQAVKTIWTVNEYGDKWAGDYCSKCAAKKRKKVRR